MLKTIKKIANPHSKHFLNEINFINYLTDIFALSIPLEEKNMSSLQLKHEKILKEKDMQGLLQGLGIFPEQYFSFDVSEQENTTVSISHDFLYKNSQKNEKIFLNENKIRSTSDSPNSNFKLFTKKQRKLSNKDPLISYESGYDNNTILGIMQCNQLYNTSEENNDNEELYNKKKIQNLHHYKLITEVIENHLENEKMNPLAFLKKSFIEFYLQYYKKLIKEVELYQDSTKKTEYFSVIFEDSIRDLKQFIRIFQKTLYLYYQLDFFQVQMKPPFFFCKDNMLNFVTSIILSEKTFYKFLLKLQIKVLTKNEEKIEINLKECKKWNPENFNVPAKFCLNEKTLKYFEDNKNEKIREKKDLMIFEKKNEINLINFKEKIKDKRLFDEEEKNYKYLIPSPSNYHSNKKKYTKKHSKTTHMTILIEEIEKSTYKTASLWNEDFLKNKRRLEDDGNFRDLGKSVLKRSLYMKEKSKIKEFNEIEPYFLAIQNLRKITKIRSPILKLKNIIKTSIIMIDSIKKFYQKHKIEIEYQIESDDILSLFIYICAKAQVKNLFSQCRLTEKFLTSKISNSISGYYLISLLAGLTFFLDEGQIKKYNN